MTRKIFFITVILIFGFCTLVFPANGYKALSSSAPPEGPSFKSLLHLKLPKQSAELADKINSLYYNFVDKKVDTIKFRVSDSQMKDLIKKIEKKYIGWDLKIAEKLKKIRIVATYGPSRDLLTFEVFDKPEFETEQLSKIIENIFIDSTIKVYKELLTEEMACLKPLFDPEYDKAQSVEIVNDRLIIEILSGTKKSCWTFDKDYRLKSIEKTASDDKTLIKQTYEFEIFESKYLIKGLTEQTLYRYSKRDLTYQSVNGIKVPNKLSLSLVKTRPQRMSLELYFDDIEVALAE